MILVATDSPSVMVTSSPDVYPEPGFTTFTLVNLGVPSVTTTVTSNIRSPSVLASLKVYTFDTNSLLLLSCTILSTNTPATAASSFVIWSSSSCNVPVGILLTLLPHVIIASLYASATSSSFENKSIAETLPKTTLANCCTKSNEAAIPLA